MKVSGFRIALSLAGVALGGAGLAATVPPTEGKAAAGSPGWHLQKGYPDPGGRTIVAPDGTVTVKPRPERPAGAAPAANAMPPGRFPGCLRSTICGRIGGPGRGDTQRVTWDQTPGYAFSYPFQVPAGDGGVPGVAVDSKGNVWGLQRKPEGQAQLFKFAPDGHVLVTVAPATIGFQLKGHGMAVDADDNVWFTDTNGNTVMQVSPDGKLLRTLGTKGKPGDWDEAKGQRLIWQPTSLAFGPEGDMYLGEGHGNESPNDVDSADPTNNIGAARIMHFDKAGNFVGQWFGNDVGQGKFEQTHGLAVDPKTGDVWIGDREQYRIVIYSGEGKFLRTIQMRNLVCAIAFDRNGDPWIASGQDGQVLRIDRDGKVLRAAGGGMGIDPGKFIEANYFAFDKAGAIYVGDTSVGRIAKITPPKR